MTDALSRLYFLVLKFKMVISDLGLDTPYQHVSWCFISTADTDLKRTKSGEYSRERVLKCILCLKCVLHAYNNLSPKLAITTLHMSQVKSSVSAVPVLTQVI